MRSDIVAGSTFPDYALPEHTNVRRRLSEIQGDDPMILTLAPGHYCPKEHRRAPAARGLGGGQPLAVPRVGQGVAAGSSSG